ncbi:hypothetical protein KSX_55620 [Ktedonospora formicarum]|uniref:Uncharacterized protein n=1 Tax=Ktedonospora formicarum TaxID=2778364 RepID=A0A8J3I145_9CHLR|nr:hypothetical protein KSX_55620 [Ktedonospora formicarum]
MSCGGFARRVCVTGKSWGDLEKIRFKMHALACSSSTMCQAERL